MADLIYGLLIRLYALAMQVAAGFHVKAAKWVKGQQGIWEALNQQVPGDCFWVHCASVGEFEQGLPLIELLDKSFPEVPCIITFFSPSGFEFARRHYPSRMVYYLPLDSRSGARQWLKLVKPRAAFFIKYEFWYFHLEALYHHQIPVYLIAGIFRANQIFFRFYGSLHRKLLHFYDEIFVQDTRSSELLSGIQVSSKVCGDTRLDRVQQVAAKPFEDEVLKSFIQNRKVFIAGSIWPSDQETLTSMMTHLPDNWCIILAPHELKYNNIRWLNEPVQFYSHYNHSSGRILWMDTLGILSRSYRYASLAYIGGGYGKGIHNILEAAIYGMPVLMGPKYQKFKEAVQLAEAGLAFDTTQKETIQLLEKWLQHPEELELLRNKARIYMAEQANALACIHVQLAQKSWWKHSKKE